MKTGTCRRHLNTSWPAALQKKTNYLRNKKMLITINPIHRFFFAKWVGNGCFFYLCRRNSDCSVFQLYWFSCASKKQRERRYTYGWWATIMHKTPFQLPYKLLSVVGRGPACSRIRDGRFHGTVKAENENKTGFSRFIHAPL